MHNVTARDYRDHRPLALAAGDLWENHGWMVWDANDDQDLLLWLSAYRLVSRPDGPFAIRDIALSQTLFIVAPSGERKLTDTPFLQRGWEPADHLPAESLVIDIGAKRARWTIGHRSYEADPPIWRVTGSHAGVDVDLRFQATAPAFWFTDPGRSVEEIQERWFVQCAKVAGTVVRDGNVFEIDGFACHERHVHCGTKYDPATLLSARGVTWHSGGIGGTQVLVFTRPTVGYNWSRLILPDGVVDLGAGHECTVLETSHWVDPRSRLSVPSSWRVTISGPMGRVEIEARAVARAYYLWSLLSRGATVLYWWIAEASMRYELTDGRSAEYNKFTYIVHDNRLLYRDFPLNDWGVPDGLL